MLIGNFLSNKLNSRGQSIVEISLITPILLAALMVPADFGVAYFSANLMQNAVREAARIGVSTKDPFDNTAAAAIRSNALGRLPARLTNPSVTVNFYDGGSANCMKSVEVIARANYNYLLYQIMNMFGANVLPSSIQRGSRQRYEFQPVNTTSTPCTTASVHSP